MLGRVVHFVVDAEHDRHVLVLGGRADDHLFGARVQMQFRFLAVGESARGLDHDVRAQLAPGNLAGIKLRIRFQLAPIHDERAIHDADLARIATVI